MLSKKHLSRTVNLGQADGKIKITRRDSGDSLISMNSVRAIRQSTKEKTVDSDVARKKSFKTKVKISWVRVKLGLRLGFRF
jgi:hypothetical protein